MWWRRILKRDSETGEHNSMGKKNEVGGVIRMDGKSAAEVLPTGKLKSRKKRKVTKTLKKNAGGLRKELKEEKEHVGVRKEKP